MSNFLFTVWPFAGCVHPLIAVAKQLKVRGHKAAFYTGGRFQSLVENEGFAYFPFQALDENILEDLVFSSTGIGHNWNRPWKLKPQLRAFFLDSVPQQFADIRRIMNTWNADAIVSDPAMLAPFVLVYELERIPVALCSYAGGCMLSGGHAPPIGLGLPIPRNAFARLRNKFVGWAVDLFLRDMRNAASVMRQQHGLPPLKGSIVSLARQLPLYLLPSCPEYDYNRRDLPSCVRYVGPLQWYPPTEPVPWLAALSKNQPLIHVTEGTLHFQEPFVLRAAARGLANLPMHVIITTGGDRDPTRLKLGPPAANVRVERWVPHQELLPRTDVLVTTAGGGTVMAALEAGVPMVLIPTEWDKAENAQRVVEAGAGVRMSPRRCTPQGLREAVQTVLRDDSYRQNARRLAALLHRYGGPSEAAELLTQIVPVSADGKEGQLSWQVGFPSTHCSGSSNPRT